MPAFAVRRVEKVNLLLRFVYWEAEFFFALTLLYSDIVKHEGVKVIAELKSDFIFDFAFKKYSKTALF